MKLAIIFFQVSALAFAFNAEAQHKYVVTDSADDILKMHLNVVDEMPQNQAIQQQARLEGFINELDAIYHKTGSIREVLDVLFFKGQRKFLRHYTRFTTFGELMESGRYDCLTGTIFYAYCLEKLGLEHNIIETQNHTYILVDGWEYLMESTDPINGLTIGKNDVLAQLQQENYQGLYKEEVSFFETIGLQYFNAAVESYRNGELITAVDFVEDAAQYYQGERMVHLGLILSKAITESEMEAETKFTYLLKLTQTINGTTQVAGLN